MKFFISNSNLKEYSKFKLMEVDNFFNIPVKIFNLFWLGLGTYCIIMSLIEVIIFRISNNNLLAYIIMII